MNKLKLLRIEMIQLMLEIEKIEDDKKVRMPYDLLMNIDSCFKDIKNYNKKYYNE